MSECIREILTPWDFGDKDISISDFLLQPELLDMEMADFAHPLPHDYAAGGGGIRPEFKAGIIPEALGESLGVEPLDCPFEGGIELSLTR